MMCMREHVYRLYPFDAVFFRKQCQVPRLCCRIAAYVYDLWRFHFKQLVHQLFMHAGAWRVGDDHIRPSVLCKEFVIAYFDHISAEERSMLDIIQRCIQLRVVNGFLDHFHADDLFCLLTYKDADATRAAIKVIHGLIAGKACKIPGNALYWSGKMIWAIS
jgi:hypothetical protein